MLSTCTQLSFDFPFNEGHFLIIVSTWKSGIPQTRSESETLDHIWRSFRGLISISVKTKHQQFMGWSCSLIKLISCIVPTSYRRDICINYWQKCHHLLFGVAISISIYKGISIWNILTTFTLTSLKVWNTKYISDNTPNLLSSLFHQYQNLNHLHLYINKTITWSFVNVCMIVSGHSLWNIFRCLLTVHHKGIIQIVKDKTLTRYTSPQ